MTRDDIIRMAREAGFLRRQLTVYNCERIERFAELVAAAASATCIECEKSAATGWALYCVSCYAESIMRAAVEVEREACARLLDDQRFRTQSECAAAIRARSEK